MCVDNLKNSFFKEEWLKEQPDTIVAYKLARKYNSKYYPIFKRLTESFYPRRMNRITEDREEIEVGVQYYKYKPFYHLLMNEEGVKKCDTSGEWVVLKCEIPKKDITDIGEQSGCDVIVTKAFKIIEEVPEYSA